MKTHIALIGLTLGLALAAHAQDAAPPSYEECFDMAQKAMEQETAALEAEAATLSGTADVSIPATLPLSPEAQDVLDRVQAQGVTLAITPTGSYTVILPAMPVTVTEAVTVTSVPTEADEDAESADEAPAQVDRKRFCRTLYGLNF
jgi:hypothetical protein